MQNANFEKASPWSGKRLRCRIRITPKFPQLLQRVENKILKKV